MVRETRLSVDGLIYPVFVVPGGDVREEVPSMPGVYHQSVDQVVEDAREVADLGIPAMLLFGLPSTKDWEGSEAWAHDGIVQQALRAIRRAAPSLVLIADTCLCEYTSHGHCGIPGPDDQPGFIENDRSLELLTRAAVAQAEAADMVMVKPALPYLDVVHAVKSTYPDVPLAAYNVSGEYAMLKAAALNGWLDERRSVLEALTCIARAGADMTITYSAKDVARWLSSAALSSELTAVG